MHYFKKAVLKSFGLIVAALSWLSLTAAVWILAAQELAEIRHLERYALLSDLLTIERFLIAPAAAYLRANAPMTWGGVDLAPYLIAAAIIVLWATCEAELHRLRVMDWDLNQARRAELTARDEERESNRADARRTALSRLDERESLPA